MLLVPARSFAFAGNSGACGGDCRACHTLKPSEAQDILSSFNPALKVTGVKTADVGGLWQVTFQFRGRENIVYIDFAKKHLIQGAVIDIKTKQNLTGMRLSDLNKVDVSRIPLKDALIMGNPKAPLRVIVFVDPV
ncbi:MAG: hypothetical protein M0Z58_08660 [Nitrospiraceae bacterium]|nr:hypothetical protein [Nitrospiraceae bacterium]